MSELITPDLVSLDQDLGADKESVIGRLAALVQRTGRAEQLDGLLADAIARENKTATGIPGGIAIPHCRSAGVDTPTLAFARLSPGVDFGGLLSIYDGEDLIDHPVQTNEVARCSALLNGFLMVARDTGLPLRLLEEPLQHDHIKHRLLGHWGTVPGLNLVYAGLNRLIRAGYRLLAQIARDAMSEAKSAHARGAVLHEHELREWILSRFERAGLSQGPNVIDQTGARGDGSTKPRPARAVARDAPLDDEALGPARLRLEHEGLGAQLGGGLDGEAGLPRAARAGEREETDFGLYEQIASLARRGVHTTTLGVGTRARLPFRVFTLLGVPGDDRAVRLVSQVGEALGYAHQRGVIHRDVKPANIAFTERGAARVLDFGVAILGEQDSSGAQAGTLRGTVTGAGGQPLAAWSTEPSQQ